jgi:hypothetical protein
LGVASIILLSIFGSAYAITNDSFGIFRAAVSTTPKVTWRDISGSIISSVTLTASSSVDAVQTVTFTCSPSAGAVELDLTPSLSNVVSLSQTNFPLCDSSPDSVTLTAHANNDLPRGGTIHVTQPDNYRTLASPLSINVLKS